MSRCNDVFVQLNSFIIYENESKLREGLDMILTTKRLVLREIEEQDWRAVLAYQSHPLYLRYNPWTHRTELEKIGMRQEGRLRENEWMKGRWWDTLLYAILEREWQTR